MTDEELQLLNKKLDKILSINVKIAKALHLIPVSEKEERAIQILQRKNLATAAKVNDELNVMENKSVEDDSVLGINNILSESRAEIYSDIIGSDFIYDTEDSK